MGDGVQAVICTRVTLGSAPSLHVNEPAPSTPANVVQQ